MPGEMNDPGAVIIETVDQGVQIGCWPILKRDVVSVCRTSNGVLNLSNLRIDPNRVRFIWIGREIEDVEGFPFPKSLPSYDHSYGRHPSNQGTAFGRHFLCRPAIISIFDYSL